MPSRQELSLGLLGFLNEKRIVRSLGKYINIKNQKLFKSLYPYVSLKY